MVFVEIYLHSRNCNIQIVGRYAQVVVDLWKYSPSGPVSLMCHVTYPRRRRYLKNQIHTRNGHIDEIEKQIAFNFSKL